MLKKIFIISGLILLLTANFSFSQGSSLFSISGGFIIGWQIPQIDDLNSELKKIGYPEISASGQLITGAGGYVDVPFVKGLRIGGLGMGFSDDKSVEVNNTVKTVAIKYRMGGISIEYLNKISNKFDYSFGGVIGLGSFGFKIHQYPKEYQNWNTGNFVIDTTGSNNSITNNYNKDIYIIQPQIGIGYQAASFLYLKLNAGYMLSLSENWKLNDVLEVNNVPSGIKADGFSFNLGINIGLFVN